MENCHMSATTDIEKQNLEAHVELCAQRYDALEKRLGNVETMLTGLKSAVEASHLNTVKVLIGSAGTVIVGVLSLIGIIITKMP
jgi:prefoldin subunit 5